MQSNALALGKKKRRKLQSSDKKRKFRKKLVMSLVVLSVFQFVFATASWINFTGSN